MNKAIIILIYLITIITIPTFEVLIKSYIRRKLIKRLPITINNGHIKIHYLSNNGMMFGVLKNKRVFLMMITIIALIIALAIPLYLLLAVEGLYLLKVAALITASGSLSNSLERFIYHHVIDYFSFPKARIKRIRPIVFNLADICIFMGMFIMYIYLLGYFISLIIKLFN